MKYNKAMKLLKKNDIHLFSRYNTNKLSSEVAYEEFKVEWVEKSTNVNSNAVKNIE